MRKPKPFHRPRKHVLPLWNKERHRSLVFRNKMRVFRDIQAKPAAQVHTVNWHNLRQLTIPSSLVRKAVSGSENFLRYYETVDVYSIGTAIEAVVLSIFGDLIAEGKQIFSRATL